jgi:hypothetical protein
LLVKSPSFAAQLVHFSPAHGTSELDSDTLRVAGASDSGDRAVGDRAEVLRGTGAPVPGRDMAVCWK